MNNPERYVDKPFRRIFEGYILLAIDQLPAERAGNLTAMQPHLAKIYGYNLPWNQIVEKVMELPENMVDILNDMWSKNTAIAENHGITLHPQQFAEMFVDQNLED